MARGKLTQSEKYIIEGMLKDKHASSEIAKELGRTKKTIENYQAEVKKRASKQNVKRQAKKQAEKESDIPRAKDLMGKETVLKKSGGVSIMTEAASARGDESVEASPSRMSKGAIYRIDGSEND